MLQYCGRLMVEIEVTQIGGLDPSDVEGAWSMILETIRTATGLMKDCSKMLRTVCPSLHELGQTETTIHSTRSTAAQQKLLIHTTSARHTP
jgi:hypothetical protein